MKKFLLAGVIALAPFVAFAAQDHQNGGAIAGNLALTGSLSAAGVESTQGTMAGAMVKGDGAVVVGTVSGNYTSIDTTGKARAGLGYANTETKTTQTNIGGTVSGGFANEGRGFGNVATGTTGGAQQSAAAGGSIAGAADLGGFIKVEQPKPDRPHGRR